MRFMQTGAGRPFIARQVICTKDSVYKGKYGSKVFTVIFWILAMVPVVVLRRCNNIFQEAKINTGIGMNKHRMNGHKNNIGIKSNLRKPEYIQWYKSH